MKQIIFYFALLTALIMSCTEEERDYTGNIQGIVTESGTTTPLSGVQVSVVNLGTSTTTGSDGQFLFNSIEADSYQLQFKKTGFITNTRNVNVLAGETAKCDIQLEPEKKEAEIEIEPSTLNFGTSQTELSVIITNHGNTTTEWSLNLGDNAWLSASPLSGNIASNKTQSIVFSVNRDRLSETKNVKVVLSAFGNSYTISVSCAPKNAKSEMSITPTTIDFGHESTELPLTVRNTGATELTYTVSGISTSYITVSPMEGNIPVGGNQVLQVKLDREIMPENINTTFIISDGIKQEVITVKATKAASKMTVSPLSLDFGEDATEKTFTISNVGTAELTWNITVPAGTGLKVSDTSGTIYPSNTKQITVILDRSVMPQTLNASIDVSTKTQKETILVKAVKRNDISETVVSQGLYTYYKFDGNFEDATENEIHGFGTASPTFVEGVTSESKAVKFSKTNNSSFVVSKPIIDNKQMTICFWGKDFSDGHIFHLTSSQNYQTMLSLSMENGALKFVAFSENHAFPYFNQQQTFIHPTLTDGKWHHIALVSDNTEHYLKNTTTLYVDGMEVYVLTEKAWTSSSYGKGTSFIMGGSLNVSNLTYNQLSATNMSVDNFRVYDNRKLSASEIKEIYNAKQ